MNLKEYILNRSLRVPTGKLMYSPQMYCRFSEQGGEMVNRLIETSPTFHKEFNRLVSIETQRRILTESFSVMKKAFDEREAKRLSKLENDPCRQFREGVLLEAAQMDGETTNKKFYQTNRSYSIMVPEVYNRTEAPRISARGNTLHGLKKDLSGKVLKTLIRLWQKNDKSYSILDLDMSAAHTRFAIGIMGTHNCQLYEAIMSKGKFWDENAVIFTRALKEVGVIMPEKGVRALLKVCLYTCLNGGNPLSAQRLFKNLTDQEPSLTQGFGSMDSFTTSNLFLNTRRVLSSFNLLEEVKELNKKCVAPDGLRTYTLDRQEPYVFDSQHKGISRALQGYEVVLLTVLVQKIICHGGLPINLAHDGAMALFPGVIDDQALVESLTRDMDEWSDYLLNGLTLPIECKFNYNTSNTEPEG